MNAQMRILCVDDNPRNQIIVRKLLSSYELREARSGEEALEVAVEFQPDLILLDIMMPGMDGYETCRRLRAMKDALRSPKIIIVSAKAIVSERLEGYAAGADDYITKPFNADELLAKVAVYLRLKSMEELDRLRDHVVTLLQHETRTPLASLLGAVDLLRSYGSEALRDPNVIGAIEDSAHRLNDLIDRVVLLSRLRSGALPHEPVTTRMDVLVGGVVMNLQPAAAERGVTLERRGSTHAACELDGHFGTYVLRALIDNALHHTGPGGRVVVETSVDDVERRLELTVHDNGTGIDPRRLQEVQREFVVGDLANHGRGAGLGLPIARLLVQAHGGELQLESTPGRGVVARVRLPIADAREGSAEEQARDAA